MSLEWRILTEMFETNANGSTLDCGITEQARGLAGEKAELALLGVEVITDHTSSLSLLLPPTPPSPSLATLRTHHLSLQADSLAKLVNLRPG
jgi:hypothetical protein